MSARGDDEVTTRWKRRASPPSRGAGLRARAQLSSALIRAAPSSMIGAAPAMMSSRWVIRFRQALGVSVALVDQHRQPVRARVPPRPC